MFIFLKKTIENSYSNEEIFKEKYSENDFTTFMKIIRVDKMEVEKMGVDEKGSKQNWNKPQRQHNYFE